VLFLKNLTAAIGLLHQHRQQGIVPQLLVIVQIFVSQGQTIDSLGHHLLQRVFDQIGIPIIGKAGGKLAQYPDTFSDLPQEQTTAIAADRSAIELGSNLTAFLGMKSDTNWVHSVVIRLFPFVAGFLSRQKSYAMKRQPFPIYL
jgi:hypothetical protein